MSRRPTVEEVLADVAKGHMVIVADDANPGSGADLTMAAELCDADDVGFMRTHASGVICTPMTGARLDDLRLPLMAAQDENGHGSAFTLSVDAKDGITTGISAADRARTIGLLADQKAGASDFVRPGHIFPLRAREGGVLVRPAQTEAAVDLCGLAGLEPVGVISHITNPDGSIAMGSQLKRFARKHDLKVITVGDLIAYRAAREHVVERVATTKVRAKQVTFTSHAYRNLFRDREVDHVALFLGDVSDGRSVVAHFHHECLGGDVFGSTECDCGALLDGALATIAAAGRGVFVYLRGRSGDPHLRPAGQSDHIVGMQILRDLGVRSTRIVTSDPPKAGVAVPDLKVTDWTTASRTPRPSA